MSKSLGNFVTVRDALKTCNPRVLRFFLISAHYRSPIDFNQENLRLAETTLHRLSDALRRLRALSERRERTSEEEVLLSDMQKARKRFEEAMDDDFNTPLAISALLDIAKAMNNYSATHDGIESSAREEVLETLTRLLTVLGLEAEPEKSVEDQSAAVKSLMNLILDLRRKMRERKDWETADELRGRLEGLGFNLEDTPEGTKWKKQRP